MAYWRENLEKLMVANRYDPKALEVPVTNLSTEEKSDEP